MSSASGNAAGRTLDHHVGSSPSGMLKHPSRPLGRGGVERHHGVRTQVPGDTQAFGRIAEDEYLTGTCSTSHGRCEQPHGAAPLHQHRFVGAHRPDSLEGVHHCSQGTGCTGRQRRADGVGQADDVGGGRYEVIGGAPAEEIWRSVCPLVAEPPRRNTKGRLRATEQ